MRTGLAAPNRLTQSCELRRRCSIQLPLVLPSRPSLLHGEYSVRVLGWCPVQVNRKALWFNLGRALAFALVGSFGAWLLFGAGSVVFTAVILAAVGYATA